MSFNPLIVTSIIIFLSAIISAGYKIDNSCRDEGIYDKVEDALHSAFETAQAGKDALERSIATSPNWADVPPRHPELQNLIKNIFAHDDIISNKQPEVPENERSKYNFQQNMRNIKLWKVYDTLSLILTWMQQPTDDPNRGDLIIYCNMDRLEFGETEGNKWALDKREDNGYKEEHNGKECTSAETGFSRTMAYTISGPKTYNGDVTKYHPSPIQLCHLTVEYAKGAKMLMRKQIVDKSLIAKFAGKLTEHRVLGFRQMDVYNLLDVTLLHEMTHTPAVGDLEDVRWEERGLMGVVTKEAYQWNYVLKLAKKNWPGGPAYVDKKDYLAPDNNAESVAYFALGCKLMSDPDHPQRITDFGSLEPIKEGPVTWDPASW